MLREEIFAVEVIVTLALIRATALVTAVEAQLQMLDRKSVV